MSNTKNTGGPAFPTAMEEHKDGILHFDMPGMSLRDYFAAKAMVAVLTGHQRNVVEVAKEAYIVADAMLKAREQ